jgi:hypothetical protein
MRWLGLSLATGGLALLLLAGLLGINLWTYHRFTGEQAVAYLRFTRIAHNSYNVEVDLPAEKRRSFHLQGDDWQLDVRMIAWAP